ncbi:hypothetical protein BPTFM16_01529 [Altererythrobacter insulae]|nr:hypothetical protein BPTFM16_01529 [Altererythrobacter insulae]
MLAIEIQALVDIEFDTELTRLSLAEVDLVLDEAAEADLDTWQTPIAVRRHPAAARNCKVDGWRERGHRVYRSALQCCE